MFSKEILYYMAVIGILIIACTFIVIAENPGYPMKPFDYKKQLSLIRPGMSAIEVDSLVKGYNERKEQKGIIRYIMRPQKRRGILRPYLSLCIIVRLDEKDNVIHAEWADL